MRNLDPDSPVAVASFTGHAPSGSDSKSPLSSMGLVDRLTGDRKQTKDGQPAKRRGPKPDSKPALTRRQELNRQAQRTHRERKENYTKQLEHEVLKLKESWANTLKENEGILAENQRLKELLRAHGITYDFNASPIRFTPGSSGSISGSYGQTSESATYSPGRTVGGASQSISPPIAPNQQRGQQRSMAQLPNNNMNYDDIGIDFVLTLERPCMDHMQYLMIRSHNPDGQPFHHPMENPDDAEHEHMSGHALMSTAPPQSHIMQKPDEKYPFQMPEFSPSVLSTLLDLSNRVPFDHHSEIMPIQAWSLIYRHERLSILSEKDLLQIKDELSSKTRCYGFGAVLEEFEVRDALENVFATKDSNMPVMTQSFNAQHISPRQATAVRAH